MPEAEIPLAALVWSQIAVNVKEQTTTTTTAEV